MKIGIQIQTMRDELAGIVLDMEEEYIEFEEWNEKYVLMKFHGRHLIEKKYLKWLLPLMED